VDRLTTGRRHARAGSVTVTELLTKQATPSHCTDSSFVERDFATEPIAALPTTHRRPRNTGAQLAKLGSLGLACTVLCGAVAIASMISHRRETAQPAKQPTVRITGEQALLPDHLSQTLSPTASDPAVVLPPQTEETQVADVRPESTESDTTAETAGGQAQEGTAASSDSAATPASDLDLVRRFYANLPHAPATAFGLLSSDLLNTSLGEFLQSWSTVSSIDGLDLEQRADGVLATVRMRLSDGGHLRIQQLVTVAESPRRIVGVQLLSAQRN
jgi:hypothetical protein